MGKKGNIDLVLPKNNADKTEVEKVLTIVKNHGGIATSSQLHDDFINIYDEGNLNDTTISHRTVTPRYFGLLYYIKNRKKYELTEYGKKYLEATSNNEKIDVIMDSISSISFGCRNNGVSSKSNIEPPIVLLKLIQDYANTKLIHFSLMLYFLSVLNLSYEDAINRLRTISDESVEKATAASAGASKFFDPKIHLFLIDMGIITRNEETQILSFSTYIINNYDSFIKMLNPFNTEIPNSNIDKNKSINEINNINLMNDTLNSILSSNNVPDARYKKMQIKTNGSIKIKRAFRDKGKNLSSTKLSKKLTMLIGWLGERYIYNLLNKESAIFQSLNISKNDIRSIEWFNKGFESVKNWEDKSQGHGCDIIINLKNKKKLALEIKTSYNAVSFYSVSTNELISMSELKTEYYILKIDNLVFLSQNKSPSILTINNPINQMTSLRKIKDISFYC